MGEGWVRNLIHTFSHCPGDVDFKRIALKQSVVDKVMKISFHIFVIFQVRHIIYCHVPARWGLQRTTLALGSDKTPVLLRQSEPGTSQYHMQLNYIE